MKQKLEAKTYIAREPCGCLVFACYNNPLTPKEVAQEVSMVIKAGYQVELVETDAVRKMNWFCEIHSEQRRLIV
ncbi:hypothetical protein [Dehalococcoides mccartyi]|uniref:hypothetical protein n=1 Tax=Dehalococcoides mccartyi TaxID=61435 RepID=UPI001A0D2D28|nr:hypothetical protein [Dehalococcoides mccartyi]MBF4483088.1 hypothetical protein [Dehalococcoides mccartyi]MBJ7531913.1 hypothetical protein [Dehalococcoides mccartyi]